VRYLFITGVYRGDQAKIDHYQGLLMPLMKQSKDGMWFKLCYCLMPEWITICSRCSMKSVCIYYPIVYSLHNCIHLNSWLTCLLQLRDIFASILWLSLVFSARYSNSMSWAISVVMTFLQFSFVLGEWSSIGFFSAAITLLKRLFARWKLGWV
jgi:hypothetical protein